MARESWVSPPLLGREAPPRWVGVWRFRLAVTLVAALLVLAVVLGYRQLAGANSQDPGVGAISAAPQAAPGG